MHIPLTTQLYFKDDPYIAKDPWASRKPSSVIDLKQDGRTLHGNQNARVNGLHTREAKAERRSVLEFLRKVRRTIDKLK